MSTASPWPHIVALGDARRGASLHLVADDAARAAVAMALYIESLESLDADIDLSEWLDGVQIDGAWRARIVQICGVSLDPFETALNGRFSIHAVPPGSPNAPAEPVGEVAIDEDSEDPPDLMENENLDVGFYVVEHLALEIDPFPRKPGVEFEQPEGPKPSSPFDVLRGLKRD